ncbi:hypothetical protein SSIN_1971 [Streptococcus sinensis]|uniref:Uncharacterized protein n=1 Tax=Streptococcus sinensis TaxID=176090 RepID=A0A0A0DDV8_9STRE|nr:hypothetical protein SSIN_1971 [Streptococcus sinensis]
MGHPIDGLTSICFHNRVLVMSFLCKRKVLKGYITITIVLSSLNLLSIFIFQDKFKFIRLKRCWTTANQVFFDFNVSCSWGSAIGICNSQISCLCWSIAVYRIYDEIAIFIDFHHTISVLYTVLICRRKVRPFDSSICFWNFFLFNTSHFFNRSTFWCTVEFEVKCWTNMFLTTNPDFISRNFYLWNFISIGYLSLVCIVRYDVVVIANCNLLSFFQRKVCLVLKFADRVD